MFANQVEEGTNFTLLFEKLNEDEKRFFRKMLGTQIKQLPQPSPEDIGDTDPEDSPLNRTVSSDPVGGRRTRKRRRSKRKTRKHRRKQIRK
jgi:hypothetical protein